MSSAAVELAFVLDASGSIGDENFQKVLELVIRTVKTLVISPYAAQVAVICFATDAKTVIRLTDHHNNERLCKNIRAIEYTNGATNTNKALDLLESDCFQQARDEIPRVVVVVTDGCSDNRSATKNAAEQVRKNMQGIKIFAAGIGKNINEDELKVIANEPSENFVIKIPNFTREEMSNLTKALWDKAGFGETQKLTFEDKVHVDLNPPRNYYRINPEGEIHGIALIINNDKFKKDGKESQEYGERFGSNIDVENLRTTFEFLRYKVHIETNCDHTKMVDLFENAASKWELQKHDSFVCCILSHGGKKGIISSNCLHVVMDDMVSPLKDCKELVGKPKMFFVQACRGKKKDTGRVGIADDDPSTEQSTIIPAGADFFFGFATEAGYRAYRTDKNQSKRGSYYIDELCKIFLTYGKHSNLISMHTMINHDISAATIHTEDHKYKQISEFDDKLRKFVYFYHQEWMD